MPKIIENLEARLIDEAEKQITKNGYGAMTMRSVAKGCGIGVGTVYNYFSCKEELVAKFLLKDWNEALADFDAISENSQTVRPVARHIYDCLTAFARRHAAIFQDFSASASFGASYSQYHRILRQQLSKPLRKFCESDFAAEFAAEALLTWTMASKDFDELYGMLEKLF
jgi:AcrR family transcriptional regulator